jgi:hypothetical protein
MALRAPDRKTEHGWVVEDENGHVVGHAASRDKARTYANHHEGENMAVLCGFTPNGRVERDERAQPVAEYAPILKQTPAEARGEVVTGTVVDDRSPEEIAAEKADVIHGNIVECVHRAAEATYELAHWLYTFQTERMYEALGYDSFNAYVSDPDTEVGVRWANELVAIYKQLVIDKGVPLEELKQLQVSKVSAVLPAVRREQVSWEQAKADVQALPKQGLLDKYSGRTTGGRPDTDSRIRTEEEPSLAECPVCKRVGRIDPNSGEWLK